MNRLVGKSVWDNRPRIEDRDLIIPTLPQESPIRSLISRERARLELLFNNLTIFATKHPVLAKGAALGVIAGIAAAVTEGTHALAGSPEDLASHAHPKTPPVHGADDSMFTSAGKPDVLPGASAVGPSDSPLQEAISELQAMIARKEMHIRREDLDNPDRTSYLTSGGWVAWKEAADSAIASNDPTTIRNFTDSLDRGMPEIVTNTSWLYRALKYLQESPKTLAVIAAALGVGILATWDRVKKSLGMGNKKKAPKTSDELPHPLDGDM